ncbi:hypothetical protein GGF31_008262 [Allomyces arbusculus]|nr:hypothetical protein GGF31_008262 [Allomyces arbusculus]
MAPEVRFPRGDERSGQAMAASTMDRDSINSTTSTAARWASQAMVFLTVIALVCLGPVLIFLFDPALPRPGAPYDLARVDPPPDNYLAMTLAVTKPDLIRGVSFLTVSRIHPVGNYAAAPGSPVLRDDMELFINGNRFNLSANTLIRDLQINLVHESNGLEMYPFDTHTLRFGLYAMTEHDRESLVMAMTANTTLSHNPFVPLAWSLASKDPNTRMAAQLTSSPALTALGIHEVQVTLSRWASTRAVSMAILTVMGLGTLVTFTTALWYLLARRADQLPTAIAHHAALLFFLPVIRASQPGIPRASTGTLVDPLVYYPSLLLSAISFSSLAVAHLAQRYVEAKRRRNAAVRQLIEDQLRHRNARAFAIMDAAGGPGRGGNNEFTRHGLPPLEGDTLGRNVPLPPPVGDTYAAVPRSGGGEAWEGYVVEEEFTEGQDPVWRGTAASPRPIGRMESGQ